MTSLFTLKLTLITAAMALTACGGGGSGNDGEGTPAAPISISGTASSGAAIAGAPVSVKCAEGSGSTTSGSDGTYALSLATARAPCVVEVIDGAITLHSMVAAGTTGSAVANVTPLTELLTAQVAGGNADALFTSFDAAAQARLSAANIADAKADLTAGLQGSVDLSGFDPIETPLAVGDVNDQKLDDLTNVLAAAQLSLSELATVLVSNPGSAAPVQTALAPSAAGCRGLKTADVRFVSLFGVSRGAVDAANLTFTPEGGSAVALTDTGDCTFTQADGTTAAVSPSSVGVNRFPIGGGNFSMSFGFPEQEIALSELTGTWNYVAYLRDASVAMSPFSPAHGRFTIQTNGNQSAPAEDCSGLDTCGPGRTDGVFTVNPEGGFDFGAAGGPVEFRNFAYRAPSSGTLMLFAYATGAGGETGLLVATKQVRTPLPENGLVTPFNTFAIGSAGTAGAISGGVSTIVAVSAAGNGSFTRQLDDGHQETVLLNTPRDGMRHRAAGSSPDTGGTPVNFNAVVQIRPENTGFSMSISSDVGQNFFSAAVDETP